MVQKEINLSLSFHFFGSDLLGVRICEKSHPRKNLGAKTQKPLTDPLKYTILVHVFKISVCVHKSSVHVVQKKLWSITNATAHYTA